MTTPVDIRMTARRKGGKRMVQPSSDRVPLITVITVVFNGVKSILPTLESVSCQTFQNYELIVVDGASTDATVELLEQRNDTIDYWISEPDAGIYDAMNKGLRLARGEWIYFLNSGDSFAGPKVLEEVAAILMLSKAGIVVGYVRLLSDGKAAGRFPLDRTYSGSARALFRGRFCHQALFIRRASYEDISGFDLRFPTFADFFAVYQIVLRTGEFDRVDMGIADFDMGGVSSDYRNSVPLYREREFLFSQLGEGKSASAYAVGLCRAFAYKYKRMALNKL